MHAAAVDRRAAKEGDAVARLAGGCILVAVGEARVHRDGVEVGVAEDRVERTVDRLSLLVAQHAQREGALRPAVALRVLVFRRALDLLASLPIAGPVIVRGDVAGCGLGEDGDRICRPGFAQCLLGMNGGVALVVGIVLVERVADAGGVHAEERDQCLHLAVAMKAEHVHGAIHRQVPFALAAAHDVGIAVVGGQGAVPRHRHVVVERRLVELELGRRGVVPGADDRVADRVHHRAQVRRHEARRHDVVQRFVASNRRDRSACACR